VGLFVSGCTLCLLTSLKNRRGRRQSRLFICMSRIMLMLTHFSSFTASRSIKTTQGRMELLYLFFFLPFFAYFCCLFFCLFFVYFFFCRFFKCSEWFRPFVSVGLRCARALSVGSIWRLNLAATAPDRRATPCRFPLLPGRLGACSPARSNFWRFPLFGGYPGACSCSEQFLAFSTDWRVSRGLLLLGALVGVFRCSERGWVSSSFFLLCLVWNIKSFSLRIQGVLLLLLLLLLF